MTPVDLVSRANQAADRLLSQLQQPVHEAALTELLRGEIRAILAARQALFGGEGWSEAQFLRAATFALAAETAAHDLLLREV